MGKSVMRFLGMTMKQSGIRIAVVTVLLTAVGMAHAQQVIISDNTTEKSSGTSIGSDSLVNNKSKIVTWATPNFPPYIILDGKNKGKGIDNQIAEDISRKLTNYKYKFAECNYKRLQEMIKEKEQMLVTPIFITPERQKFVLFSEVASYLVLPNGFIIRKEDRPKYLSYLSEEGTLDIEKILASEKISIGINFGRSYSGILDEMIKKYKDSGKFYEKTSPDLSESMIKMLDMKRIDAALGFPCEIQYVCDELGIDRNNFEIIPVTGMVPYSAVYFGGPQSEWGEKVMKEINAILRTPGTIAQYVSYYESWLDKSSKDRYKKVLEMYYAEKYPDIYKTLVK